MQREWAAHNSRVASIEKGGEVVFKAPCDVDVPPKPAAAAGPKVSAVPDAQQQGGVDPEIARRVAGL